MATKKKVWLSLSMTPGLLAELDKYAVKESRSRSGQARIAIQEMVAQRKKAEAKEAAEVKLLKPHK